MNTRFYEVTVKSTKTMLIEVKFEDGRDDESEKAARDYALNAFTPRFDNAFVSGNVEVLSVDYVETKQQFEQSKKSCDEFLPF